MAYCSVFNEIESKGLIYIFFIILMASIFSVFFFSKWKIAIFSSNTKHCYRLDLILIYYLVFFNLFVQINLPLQAMIFRVFTEFKHIFIKLPWYFDLIPLFFQFLYIPSFVLIRSRQRLAHIIFCQVRFDRGSFAVNGTNAVYFCCGGEFVFFIDKLNIMLY